MACQQPCGVNPPSQSPTAEIATITEPPSTRATPGLRLLIGICAFALALLAAAAAWTPRAFEGDLSQTVRHRDASWSGAGACRACHPDQFSTWARTYHSTMTQEATPDAVLGAFDGQTLDYWGARARPIRRGDQFFIEYLDSASDATTRSFSIVRTVGSHRYQQYLTPGIGDSGALYRLPLLWHIGERRWIHLNGAFLGPDEAGYDDHLSPWNPNCIFCHNTGPNPGMVNYDVLTQRSAAGESVDVRFEARYQSEVAELGIACESCHAPAGEHARRNRNPLRRYLLHLGGADDPSIVHPEKLSKERSVQVCGQCHGQRLPEPRSAIRTFMTSGPIYRAGEDLTDSIEPIFAHSPGPASDPDLFRQRFWGDGTARLSAYEYQGVLQSPCYQRGELTCTTCHRMHGGDVAGNIEPEDRGNRPCLACHEDVAADVGGHTRHDASGPGSLCYDCHMPRLAYGVLEIHRSHRIESPDVARDVESGRPNACLSCHLDRTPRWVAEQMASWWGESYRAPLQRVDGPPLDTAGIAAELFAGDPVNRSVAARLAARAGTGLNPEQRAFVVTLLVAALRDEYPAVRWFARLSLLDLLVELREREGVEALRAAVDRFDYIAAPAARERATAELETAWRQCDRSGLPPAPAGVPIGASGEIDAAALGELTVLQSTKRIDIGE